MTSTGTPRPGDRRGNVRIRRARRQSQTVVVPEPERHRPSPPSTLIIPMGFVALIALGTGLLLLPFATRSGDTTEFTTALFTATSAVCVTGLVVVDTYDYWSPFGQGVILGLIQLGGLGFMTSATLALIMFGRRLTLRQRLVTGETLGRLGVARVGHLIRRMVLATVAIEAVGAVVLVGLFSLFADDAGLTLRNLWRGVFVAVSAFNNAGFDVEGDFVNLIPYQNNPAILLSVAALIAIGGTGYAVWSDILGRRRWSLLALDTKLVLVTYAGLYLVGTAGILALEFTPGGVLDGLGPQDALTQSFAMSVFPRTAGFTAVNLAEVRDATLFLIAGLMFIGGASASTAGGIKVTTFSTLFFAILASLRGEDHVRAFDRVIPDRQIYRSLSVALLSVAVVFLLTFGLSVTVRFAFIDLLFEAVSAFGTVGLSTGVTPELPDRARLLLSAGMFIGRLGPLTIALALAGRAAMLRYRYPEEDVSIG